MFIHLRFFRLRCGSFAWLHSAVVVCIAAAGAAAAEAPGMHSTPTWATIEKQFKEQFVTPPASVPGGIFTQADAAGFFDRLKKLGWDVSDRSSITSLLLADNDALVGEMRNSSARGFAAQVQKMPGAYDKLDRLIRLPNGVNTVRDLARGKDGYKMIEYLSSTKGGAEMGKMLSKGSKDDFNKPTGRLYTAEQFLARLRQSYEAAAAAEKDHAGKAKSTAPAQPR